MRSAKAKLLATTKEHLMKIPALAALTLALIAPAFAHETSAQPTRLTLSFETGAQSGSVMVSLFDSETAYAGGTPLRRAQVDVAGGARTAIFNDLPPGTYAVKAFHDVNGDGRMNANPFGIPIEPVAFSNNAPPNMGAPKWDRTHFTVRGDTTHTVKISGD
jgi:uncharacterized protein (DUF2141 family)